MAPSRQQEFLQIDLSRLLDHALGIDDLSHLSEALNVAVVEPGHQNIYLVTEKDTGYSGRFWFQVLHRHNPSRH